MKQQSTTSLLQWLNYEIYFGREMTREEATTGSRTLSAEAQQICRRLSPRIVIICVGSPDGQTVVGNQGPQIGLGWPPELSVQCCKSAKEVSLAAAAEDF